MRLGLPVAVGAAACVLLAALANAAAPTVTVRPGEAVWFLLEGAPAGACAGRDDKVRAGKTTVEEIEVLYEPAHPADCKSPPGAPAAAPARSLVVEGLGAATYNLTVTGAVALRAESVRPVSLAPSGGDALEVPIVDARTATDRCVGYAGPESPDNAIVLFATDRATAGGRCLPTDGGRGPYFRATWASARDGVTLFIAPPLKPGPVRYGEARTMGPPTKLPGLKGGPPDAPGPGPGPVGPGPAPGGGTVPVSIGDPGAIGGTGGGASTRTVVAGGLTISISGELWLGDRRKTFRPDLLAADGTIHLFIDNTSGFVRTVKVMRAWVVDATGWARKAGMVPKHPPATSLRPGETISVGLALRKLPAMAGGSAWILRVDLVAGGELHRVESGPVAVDSWR